MICEILPEFQIFLIFHQLALKQKHKIIGQAAAVSVFSCKQGPPSFNISKLQRSVVIAIMKKSLTHLKPIFNSILENPSI